MEGVAVRLMRWSTQDRPGSWAGQVEPAEPCVELAEEADVEARALLSRESHSRATNSVRAIVDNFR
jgi:hypothetical protein